MRYFLLLAPATYCHGEGENESPGNPILEKINETFLSFLLKLIFLYLPEIG
jgi:hypothetical protein